jgi:hypothetical protein
MAVTQSSPPPLPAPDGQIEASATPPLSPVQSRLRWMELATKLLLFASIMVFAWAAVTALVRPAARRFLEPISSHSRTPDDHPSGSPTDFFRDDDELGSEPRAIGPSRSGDNVTEDDDSNDDSVDAGKVTLQAATARKDAKLYGQPSEQSVEMGQVRAGDTIFVMKESAGWVMVLRGEGAMMGWMRRDNVSAR